MQKNLEELKQRLQPLQDKIKDYQTQFLQSTLWQNSVHRWQQFSKREQYLLGGAAVIIVLTLIYSMILSPLDTAIANYQQNIIKDQELLAFMRTAAPRLLAAHGEIQPTENITVDQLLPTMENTLKEEGLLDKNLSELSLVDGNGVHLQFTGVDFNLLLIWLVDLRQKYGLSVEQFSARPSDLPGIVNVDLLIVLTK